MSSKEQWEDKVISYSNFLKEQTIQVFQWNVDFKKAEEQKLQHKKTWRMTLKCVGIALRIFAQCFVDIFTFQFQSLKKDWRVFKAYLVVAFKFQNIRGLNIVTGALVTRMGEEKSRAIVLENAKDIRKKIKEREIHHQKTKVNALDRKIPKVQEKRQRILEQIQSASKSLKGKKIAEVVEAIHKNEGIDPKAKKLVKGFLEAEKELKALNQDLEKEKNIALQVYRSPQKVLQHQDTLDGFGVKVDEFDTIAKLQDKVPEAVYLPMSILNFLVINSVTNKLNITNYLERISSRFHGEKFVDRLKKDPSLKKFYEEKDAAHETVGKRVGEVLEAFEKVVPDDSPFSEEGKPYMTKGDFRLFLALCDLGRFQAPKRLGSIHSREKQNLIANKVVLEKACELLGVAREKQSIFKALLEDDSFKKYMEGEISAEKAESEMSQNASLLGIKAKTFLHLASIFFKSVTIADPEKSKTFFDTEGRRSSTKFKVKYQKKYTRLSVYMASVYPGEGYSQTRNRENKTNLAQEKLSAILGTDFNKVTLKALEYCFAECKRLAAEKGISSEEKSTLAQQELLLSDEISKRKNGKEQEMAAYQAFCQALKGQISINDLEASIQELRSIYIAIPLVDRQSDDPEFLHLLELYRLLASKNKKRALDLLEKPKQGLQHSGIELDRDLAHQMLKQEIQEAVKEAHPERVAELASQSVQLFNDLPEEVKDSKLQTTAAIAYRKASDLYFAEGEPEKAFAILEKVGNEVKISKDHPLYSVNQGLQTTHLKYLSCGGTYVSKQRVRVAKMFNVTAHKDLVKDESVKITMLDTLYGTINAYEKVNRQLVRRMVSVNQTFVCQPGTKSFERIVEFLHNCVKNKRRPSEDKKAGKAVRKLEIRRFSSEKCQNSMTFELPLFRREELQKTIQSLFKHQSSLSGISVTKSPFRYYPSVQEGKRYLEDEKFQNTAGAGWKIQVKGLGTIEIGADKNFWNEYLTVRVNSDSDKGQNLQRLLSYVGLPMVLLPSREEDELNANLLRVLMEFDPKKAYEVDPERIQEELETLSGIPKSRIWNDAKSMQKKEIWEGNREFVNPLRGKEAWKAGGRAFGMSIGAKSTTKTALELVSILKSGCLSSTEKKRQGTLENKLSPSGHSKMGSSDMCLLRPLSQKAFQENFELNKFKKHEEGRAFLLFDVSLAERMPVYQAKNFKGTTNPYARFGSFLDKLIGSDFPGQQLDLESKPSYKVIEERKTHETLFKLQNSKHNPACEAAIDTCVGSGYLYGIVVKSPKEKVEMLKVLHEEGVTKIRGKAVEECIFVSEKLSPRMIYNPYQDPVNGRVTPSDYFPGRFSKIEQGISEKNLLQTPGWTRESLYPSLNLYTYSGTYFERPQKIRVVKWDNPELSDFELKVFDTKDYCNYNALKSDEHDQRMDLLKIAEKHPDLAVMINGGYFHYSHTAYNWGPKYQVGDPLGLVKVEGKLKYHNPKAYLWGAIAKTNACAMNIFDTQHNSKGISEAKEALGCAPILITQGKRTDLDRKVEAVSQVRFGGPLSGIGFEVPPGNYHSHKKVIAARTVVGKTKDGSILFVTIDSRSKEAKGMTLYEVQHLMQGLGAVNALNLDGGGSTKMILKRGKSNPIVINKPGLGPGDGEVRKNPSAIGIVRKQTRTRPVSPSSQRKVTEDGT